MAAQPKESLVYAARTGQPRELDLWRSGAPAQGAKARARRGRLRRARRVRTLAVLFVLLVAALVLFLFPRVVHTQAPGEAMTGIEYTVRPGDTLWEIASRYAGRRDIREFIWRIEKANGLRSTEIQPGQVLFIPALPGTTLAGR